MPYHIGNQLSSPSYQPPNPVGTPYNYQQFENPSDSLGLVAPNTNWQVGISPGKKTDTLTKYQQGYLNDISVKARLGMNQANPVYGGETVPGANLTQQQVYNAAPGMLDRQINAQPAIGQQMNQVADTGAVQQFYQENVVNPSRQGFRDTLDTVGERYGSTFGNSGGMLRQMGQAANDYQTNLSGQLAGLMYDERGRAEQQRNLGIQNSFAEQESYNKSLGAQLAIGGDQRSIRGQINQGNIAQWNAAQEYNNPWIQSVAPLVLGTQAFVPQEDGPSGLTQALGAIGGIGQAIGSIYGAAKGG